MTERFVVLLRGVNVGGHNRLPMADLRRVLEAVGGADVVTHLQSGNAVLTADGSEEEWERRVGDGLRSGLSLDVRVVVRTVEEVAEAVDADPWPDVDRAHRHLGFLTQPVAPATWAAFDRSAYIPEEAVPVDRVLHLLTPGGLGRSKLSAAITAKRLGGAEMTVRNWATTTAVLAKART